MRIEAFNREQSGASSSQIFLDVGKIGLESVKGKKKFQRFLIGMLAPILQLDYSKKEESNSNKFMFSAV